MQKKRRSAQAKPEMGIRMIRISTASIVGGMIPQRYQQDPQLNHLAASIARFGLLQPIIVRRGEEGQFELVCGVRRLAACRLLGRREIDAVLLTGSREKAVVCFLEEHATRCMCDGISEAEAIALAGDPVIKASGAFCQSQIDKRQELLTLPESVRRLAKEKHLSADQLCPLLGVSSPERQLEAATIIAERALSPRQVERLVYGPPKNSLPCMSGKRRAVRAAMEEISEIAMRLRRQGIRAKVSLHTQEDGLRMQILFEHGENRKPAGFSNHCANK
ncbi:MAG: ParB N-terminal domain-containing protein [Clostridia bacterium]|nr:ParB N-terminal domain-containing protein [Clostridia bacterium]